MDRLLRASPKHLRTPSSPPPNTKLLTHPPHPKTTKASTYWAKVVEHTASNFVINGARYALHATASCHATNISFCDTLYGILRQFSALPLGLNGNPLPPMIPPLGGGIVRGSGYCRSRRRGYCRSRRRGRLCFRIGGDLSASHPAATLAWRSHYKDVDLSATVF